MASIQVNWTSVRFTSRPKVLSTITVVASGTLKCRGIILSFLGVLEGHECLTRFVYLELTRFPAHPIVSQGSQEGVPDGTPPEVSGRVPA